jgi:DNA-3-methyladenine glycosylase II
VAIECLYPTPLFDFAKMLKRPLSRPSRLAVIDSDSLTYTTAVRLTTRAVPITVACEGTVDEPALILSYPDDVSEHEQAVLRERVRFMFSVDRDLTPFYGRLSEDPVWAQLIQLHYGLRPIHDADLFESMIKAIIGQQVNVKFAATLVERIVDFGGESVEWNGLRLPVFPSPETVAGWSPEQLQALSFSRRKAEYVIDFARAVVHGKLDLDGLWHMTDEQIHATLTPLRGIGRWTVECLLLFGMGRPDVLPAADIGVQNAVQRLYGLPSRPTEAMVRRLGQAWTPWRSYATYYLWQSLIPGPLDEHDKLRNV